MNKEEKKEQVDEAIQNTPETPMVSEEPKDQIVENSPATEEVELTLKQELFCRNYASAREFFGNGTRSYMDAYQCENADTARTEASKLLANPNICHRVASLLTLQGWNDEFVDKQNLFLIVQNADLKAKAAGIKIYNEVKKRITRSMELTNPEGVTFSVKIVKEQKDAGDSVGTDPKAK